MHTELNQNERQTQLYVKSMKLYADPVFPPVILEERSDFFLSASTMSFYIIRLVIMPFFFFLKRMTLFLDHKLHIGPICQN